MTLSHDPHIEDLLGAYALDAVEPLERADIERHLTDCPKCATEVAEHRETAALLSGGALDAPVGLWSSIEEGIAPPDNVIPLKRAPRTPIWLAAVASVAAFALVGAVILQSNRVEQLSEQVAAEQQQIDELTDLIAQDPLAAAVQAALAAPGSAIITLEPTDAAGAGEVRIVLTADGTGFVLDESLPTLDDSQTYQLWAVTDGRVISAGLFGSDVENGAFRVDVEGLSALAITPEVSGGVVVSEAAPVAVAALDS